MKSSLSLTFSFLCLSLISLSASTGIYRGPEGVMCVIPQNTPSSILQANPNWANPNVKGFIIREAWRNIEPTRGVFDFSIFTEATTLAQKYKKVVGLSVGAGELSPDWLYTDGAQQFFFTAGSDGTTQVIPEPWDPVFQTCWGEMITAFGKAFSANSRVAYIVMTGPGRDYEMGFVTDPVDIANFDLMGGQALWEMATEQIATSFIQAFPHTHVIYAMSPPTPDADGAATVEAAMSELFAQYPKQFGVACASLAPSSDPATPSIELIGSQSATSTVGFQMFGPAAVMAANQTATTGDSAQTILSEALQKGVADKAHYVEVYSSDCADSTEQTTLKTANAGLLKVAKESKSP